MRKLITFVALTLLSSYNISAQIFTSVIDETALQFRVKQVDEFFARFNYDTDYKGDKPVRPINYDDYKRNLMTLLNVDKFTDGDSLDTVACSFIDYVVKNNLKIHYEDSTWIAEARGEIVYEGKKEDVVYILQTEKVKGVIYRWVVKDVQSTIFNLYPQLPKDTITISPAEHGIGFMTIPETFNLNKKVVGTAFSKKYSRNRLAVLDFLAATNKIRFGSIKKITYHFHLPNVNFDVEHIEKDKGYNQGWLINKIQIVND